MFKRGRISDLVGDPSGRPSVAVAFCKWSDVEGSGLKSLTVCCQNPPPFKGIESVSGPCRPALVLLVISSGVSADAVPGISPSGST